MGNKNSGAISSSFRDPSGFLFYRDGLIHRQINLIYKKDYDCLMNSGLYDTLVNGGLLIPHEEVETANLIPNGAYKIIKPEQLPFISYPYEWCFSQLKDAALAALEIQKKSLGFGMSLKDCSAYNIQFRLGKPVFIDTLSFEEYREGHPWVAYRQFCQHFLAPLALMSYSDIRLNQLLRIYIDGIPLDLASRLLAMRARFVFPLLVHIYFHAQAQKHFADKSMSLSKGYMTRHSFLGLIDSLQSAVRRLKYMAKGTEWANYYDNTNYSLEGVKHKKQIVSDFLVKISPKVLWDLGANTGIFSRIASDEGIQVVSFDVDYAAVEKNYLYCIANNEIKILPLLLDLTNPSPGIGWCNKERASLIERGPVDTVFALALIHHLAIFNNLPFNEIAEFFSKICNSLIIEFVPKNDSEAQKLLSARKDIFFGYSKEEFERKFEKYFIIIDFIPIRDSKRILYLMVKRM